MAVLVVPTKKCDLRCRHCMRDNFASDNIDLGLLDRFVTDVQALGNNRDWTLTGGEPTVHPEIGNLLQVFANHNIRCHIVTNGQRPAGYEQVIANRAGVKSVAVSFDSPTEKENDSTRGAGSFNKAIDAVKAYTDARISTGISFVIHDDNYHSIEQCFELAAELKVKALSIWSFQQWVNVGSNGAKYKRLNNDKDITWTDDNGLRLQIRTDLINNYAPLFSATLGSKFEQHYTKPNWPTGSRCMNKPTENNPAEERIILLPDGKVSLCCDLYDVDYNATKFTNDLGEEPLSDIIGDFSVESLDQILENKILHFKELERRRKRDAAYGLLTDGRENVCTNCAYYHYQPAKSSKLAGIPIVTS